MGPSYESSEEAEPYQQLIEEDTCDHSEEEERIIYTASFEELASSHLLYDTVIWVLISLLLVLAWGVGIFMLLYLPIRRYILQRDISSRRLYITPMEIVYKVSRPCFLPFLGVSKIEKRISLPLIIDIIIEQGCLQSAYGLHTFRVENIAHRKAAPVDQLQVQGVNNPQLLRKIIMNEASKSIQHRKNLPVMYVGEEGTYATPTGSMTEVSAINGLLTPNWKMRATASPRLHAIPGDLVLNKLEHMRATASPRLHAIPGDLVLNKLEHVKISVKRIESLLEESHISNEGS